LKPLPLPAVQTAGISQPIGVMPVATPAIGLGASVGEASPAIFETPNLNSDDAPPALPSVLQSFTSAGMSRPQAPSREAAPPTPPRQVVQASVEQPLADALVHQADALISDSPDAGLEQAIYFEASDQ
jgi:hypothetical protein